MPASAPILTTREELLDHTTFLSKLLKLEFIYRVCFPKSPDVKTSRREMRWVQPCLLVDCWGEPYAAIALGINTIAAVHWREVHDREL